MKAVLIVILQMLLFLALFGVGSFLPALNLLPLWSMRATATRLFVLDGLVFMFGVYVVILAIEAAARRLRTAGGLTTLAFVLALALGLAMKFGFVSA